MALINCPECNHPMSEDAAICPNCHNPRKVDTKTCKQCGKQMGDKKRKCPECGAAQYESTPDKKQNPMTAKKNSSPMGILLLLLGLALGAGGMYVYYSQQAVPAASENEATVLQRNGMYVFINAQPKKATTPLGTYQTPTGNDLLDLLNFKGKNIADEIGDVSKTLVFDSKLTTILERVKTQYPDAQCVVFSGRLDRCDVYKFAQ